MKKPTDKKPFYLDFNWLLGFVVSMAAVIGFFYLVARPAQMRNAPQPTLPETAQVSQDNLPQGSSLSKPTWKEGISFKAPGTLPSDLLRVGDEVWVFTEEGNKLVRVNLQGENLAEVNLEVMCSKAAWDGESMWCTNTTENVSKMDPVTGKELMKFDTGAESVQSIAWDGNSLWLMVQTGSLARYDRAGNQLERKRVADYGFARDLSWMGEELWVVYIPPQLVLYDAKLSPVEKTTASCGLTQDVLDYSIDWDGKSLWFADFISGQILQCIPGN